MDMDEMMESEYLVSGDQLEDEENVEEEIQGENMYTDIYDDVCTFDLGELIETEKNKNKFLEEEFRLLQEKYDKLEMELENEQEKRSNLANNISSLFLTAKAEIDRKNKRIADLSQRLDELHFNKNRRWGYQRPGFRNNVETNKENSGTKKNATIEPELGPSEGRKESNFQNNRETSKKESIATSKEIDSDRSTHWDLKEIDFQTIREHNTRTKEFETHSSEDLKKQGFKNKSETTKEHITVKYKEEAKSEIYTSEDSKKQSFKNKKENNKTKNEETAEYNEGPLKRKTEPEGKIVKKVEYQEDKVKKEHWEDKVVKTEEPCEDRLVKKEKRHEDRQTTEELEKKLAELKKQLAEEDSGVEQSRSRSNSVDLQNERDRSSDRNRSRRFNDDVGRDQRYYNEDRWYQRPHWNGRGRGRGRGMRSLKDLHRERFRNQMRRYDEDDWYERVRDRFEYNNERGRDRFDRQYEDNRQRNRREKVSERDRDSTDSYKEENRQNISRRVIERDRDSFDRYKEQRIVAQKLLGRDRELSDRYREEKKRRNMSEKLSERDRDPLDRYEEEKRKMTLSEAVIARDRDSSEGHKDENEQNIPCKITERNRDSSYRDREENRRRHISENPSEIDPPDRYEVENRHNISGKVTGVKNYKEEKRTRTVSDTVTERNRDSSDSYNDENKQNIPTQKTERDRDFSERYNEENGRRIMPEKFPERDRGPSNRHKEKKRTRTVSEKVTVRDRDSSDRYNEEKQKRTVSEIVIERDTDASDRHRHDNEHSIPGKITKRDRDSFDGCPEKNRQRHMSERDGDLSDIENRHISGKVTEKDRDSYDKYKEKNQHRIIFEKSPERDRDPSESYKEEKRKRTLSENVMERDGYSSDRNISGKETDRDRDFLDRYKEEKVTERDRDFSKRHKDEYEQSIPGKITERDRDSSDRCSEENRQRHTSEKLLERHGDCSDRYKDENRHISGKVTERDRDFCDKYKEENQHRNMSEQLPERNRDNYEIYKEMERSRNASERHNEKHRQKNMSEKALEKEKHNIEKRQRVVCEEVTEEDRDSSNRDKEESIQKILSDKVGEFDGLKAGKTKRAVSEKATDRDKNASDRHNEETRLNNISDNVTNEETSNVDNANDLESEKLKTGNIPKMDKIAGNKNWMEAARGYRNEEFDNFNTGNSRILDKGISIDRTRGRSRERRSERFKIDQRRASSLGPTRRDRDHYDYEEYGIRDTEPRSHQTLSVRNRRNTCDDREEMNNDCRRERIYSERDRRKSCDRIDVRRNDDNRRTNDKKIESKKLSRRRKTLDERTFEDERQEHARRTMFDHEDYKRNNGMFDRNETNCDNIRDNPIRRETYLDHVRSKKEFVKLQEEQRIEAIRKGMEVLADEQECNKQQSLHPKIPPDNLKDFHNINGSFKENISQKTVDFPVPHKRSKPKKLLKAVTQLESKLRINHDKSIDSTVNDTLFDNWDKASVDSWTECTSASSAKLSIVTTGNKKSKTVNIQAVKEKKRSKERILQLFGSETEIETFAEKMTKPKETELGKKVKNKTVEDSPSKKLKKSKKNKNKETANVVEERPQLKFGEDNELKLEAENHKKLDEFLDKALIEMDEKQLQEDMYVNNKINIPDGEKRNTATVKEVLPTVEKARLPPIETAILPAIGTATPPLIKTATLPEIETAILTPIETATPPLIKTATLPSIETATSPVIQTASVVRKAAVSCRKRKIRIVRVEISQNKMDDAVDGGKLTENGNISVADVKSTSERIVNEITEPAELKRDENQTVVENDDIETKTKEQNFEREQSDAGKEEKSVDNVNVKPAVTQCVHLTQSSSEDKPIETKKSPNTNKVILLSEVRITKDRTEVIQHIDRKLPSPDQELNQKENLLQSSEKSRADKQDQNNGVRKRRTVSTRDVEENMERIMEGEKVFDDESFVEETTPKLKQNTKCLETKDKHECIETSKKRQTTGRNKSVEMEGNKKNKTTDSEEVNQVLAQVNHTTDKLKEHSKTSEKTMENSTNNIMEIENNENITPTGKGFRRKCIKRRLTEDPEIQDAKKKKVLESVPPEKNNSTMKSMIEISGSPSENVGSKTPVNAAQPTVKRRITPIPVKDNPVCSFENILSKSQSPSFNRDVSLNHENEIPLLHLEDHSFSFCNEELTKNPDLFKLLEGVTISNLEYDKFKIGSDDSKTSVCSLKELTFENFMEKASSTPLVPAAYSIKNSKVSHTITSSSELKMVTNDVETKVDSSYTNTAHESNVNISETTANSSNINSLNPALVNTTSRPRIRRRRCRIVKIEQ